MISPSLETLFYYKIISHLCRSREFPLRLLPPSHAPNCTTPTNCLVVISLYTPLRVNCTKLNQFPLSHVSYWYLTPSITTYIRCSISMNSEFDASLTMKINSNHLFQISDKTVKAYANYLTHHIKRNSNRNSIQINYSTAVAGSIRIVCRNCLYNLMGQLRDIRDGPSIKSSETQNKIILSKEPSY